jgi:hypothetical protein
MTMTPVPTPADLRSALARECVRLYLVASRVRLHPSRLSRLINEHEPLNPALAHELADAIEAEARARSDGARR